jgi:uncharacterized membrane protein (GlpM family)
VTAGRRAVAIAAAADVVAVLVFVAVGRRSHDEPGNAVVGALRVAAPFLIGLTVAWLASRAWRRPTSLVTGLTIWPITVAVGMVFRRTLFDRGTAASFVVVATIATGVMFLGWRLLASRVRITSR